jgi:hypothetical protein
VSHKNSTWPSTKRVTVRIASFNFIFIHYVIVQRALRLRTRISDECSTCAQVSNMNSCLKGVVFQDIALVMASISSVLKTKSIVYR